MFVNTLKKARSNFFGEVNCAFFLNFFFFKTSCCSYIHLSAGQKPHTENYSWNYRDCLSLTLPGFPSFLSGRERWVCTRWWVARQPPNSSLPQRPHAEDPKQNQSMSSVRNGQPTLFRMEEQMSLKLIFGHKKLKFGFKISVSKIWNRGRTCSFYFFPDMFSPVRKHFPFYPMDCSQSLNVKSSSLYRTTNTTMLVKHNKKEKKKKAEPTTWAMATVLEAGVHTGSDPDTNPWRVR